MRGKDAVKRHSARGFGITPAYAGKSRGCPAACILRRDHPRVCGEKVSQRPFRAVSAGSPPRMRGKGVHGVLQELCCGITPAYAGKSLFSGLYIRINGDHPRVCGEKRSSLAHGRYRMGSPPRMRGKVLSGLATWLPIGITPAYAGKSNVVLSKFEC